MKEELTSFDTAKLAKEKGFSITIDEIPDQTHYDENGDYSTLTIKDLNDLFRYNLVSQDKIEETKEKLKKWVQAPTQSLLQKWLRNKHSIDVQPICNYHYKRGRQYHLGIIFLNNKNEVDTIIIKETDKSLDTVNRHYDSYEEALEAGLLEALKLI